MTLACHRPSSSLVPLPRPVRAGGAFFWEESRRLCQRGGAKSFRVRHRENRLPASRPSVVETYSGTAAARKRAAEQAAQTAAEARAACEMQAAALLQS